LKNSFGVCKSWKQIAKVTFSLFHSYKNIKQIQSDRLLFISNGLYRQMYRLNVLIIKKQTMKDTQEVKVSVL